MNNKILIGSIIAVVILLLMPSIPAIQQKTIEDSEYNDMIEQIGFKEVKELGTEITEYPYPILTIILMFRLIRAEILVDISSDFVGPGYDIYNSLLFLRGIWLAATGVYLYFYLIELLEW